MQRKAVRAESENLHHPTGCESDDSGMHVLKRYTRAERRLRSMSLAQEFRPETGADGSDVSAFSRHYLLEGAAILVVDSLDPMREPLRLLAGSSRADGRRELLGVDTRPKDWLEALIIMRLAFPPVLHWFT